MSARAEAALMGALLIDPDAVRAVRPIVSPHDFESDYWREVYRLVLELDDRGRHWDYVTVDDEFDRRQGEKKRLAPLLEAMCHTPSSIYAAHYAELVNAAGKRRRIEATPKGVIAL